VLAAWDGGLVIVDLSNPASPLVRARRLLSPMDPFWDLYGLNVALSVAVDGDIAWVGTFNGRRIRRERERSSVSIMNTEVTQAEQAVPCWKRFVDGAPVRDLAHPAAIGREPAETSPFLANSTPGRGPGSASFSCMYRRQPRWFAFRQRIQQ
jgi:hypothetical protein